MSRHSSRGRLSFWGAIAAVVIAFTLVVSMIVAIFMSVP